MRFLHLPAVLGAAVMALSMPAEGKTGGPLPLDVLHRRHTHGHRRAAMSARPSPFESALEKRASCAFPTDAGLVSVTPGQKNAGWAMSPDQPCEPNTWCQFACPPGQVMAQWDPEATAYKYPQSMNGGLFCDHNGNIQKPFPDKPYCVPGVGTVKVQNNFDDVVAICQTVLPGNEAMLIPTAVHDLATLAVPSHDYWCSTAAHFYINPPGVTTKEGCVWGDESQPHGNWSPYVTGANQDEQGRTFLTLGYNPIFLESTLCKKMPDFGLKITCDGDCVGLPCSIDPTVNALNKVTSATSSTGAGGAEFCVVTVPKGVTAHVVVFDVGNPNGGPSNSGGSSSSSSSAPSSSSQTSAPSSSSQTSATASRSTAEAVTSSSTASDSSSSSVDIKSSTTTSALPTYPPDIFQNDTDSIATSGDTEGSSSKPTASAAPYANGLKSDAIPTSISMSIFSIAFLGALVSLV